MAENVKTRIILTIVIGLFGLMCFGFAVTVTEKYRTQRDRTIVLEKKLEAGKNEILKIPELKGRLIKADEEATYARSELVSVQEKLDETTEELDNVKAGLASVRPATEGGEAVEAAATASVDIEATSEKIALLTHENDSLQSRLNKANETIQALKEKASKVIARVETKTVAEKVHDETLLARLSDAEKKVQELQAHIYVLRGEKAQPVNIQPVIVTGKEVSEGETHRGLGAKFRKEKGLERPVTVAETHPAADPFQEIKGHIDTINARIADLLAYASTRVEKRLRIGLHAYKDEPDDLRQAEKGKVTTALNEILEGYNEIYNIMNNNAGYTSYERGIAKNSLSSRISVYIAQLTSKNESGTFNIYDDPDIEILLSKIQDEQRYFLKSIERLAARL